MIETFVNKQRMSSETKRKNKIRILLSCIGRVVYGVQGILLTKGRQNERMCSRKVNKDIKINHKRGRPTLAYAII